MVVLFHVQSGTELWFRPRVQLPGFTLGAGGVDLFFLISGFIMVVTSEELSGREFMRRRLIRIVPLYWLSTLVFIAAASVLPQRDGQDLSVPAIATSFLFLPYARPDGTIQPLNPVGWTLNEEMLFYVLFAASLLLPRRLRVAASVGALGGIVLAGALLRPETTALRFWSSPIVLEFGLGMLVGALYRRGARLPRGSAVILSAVAIALYGWQIGQPEPGEWWRLIAWGGPALLLLLAATLGLSPPSTRSPGNGHLPRAARWMGRGLEALGDASYSLYLLHLPALLVLRHLAGRLDLPWDAAATPWLFATVATAFAIGVASASYRLVERPLTRSLRRLAPHAEAIASRRQVRTDALPSPSGEGGGSAS